MLLKYFTLLNVIYAVFACSKQKHLQCTVFIQVASPNMMVVLLTTDPCYRDDLLRAIKKLKILGNGFTVIPVGSTFLIQSVPGELTMDHTSVLQQAQVQ